MRALKRACASQIGLHIPLRMRITGGRARGIPISTGKAGHVRPATDRMREAVFSSLGPRVDGAFFLDLFAGSGAYGLEAISRGAGSGLFVEKHPAAVNALQANIKSVERSMGGQPLSLKVIRRDVLRFQSAKKFDLIFMDPPYELIRERQFELLRLAGDLLSKEGQGILVFELPADLEPGSRDWNCLKRIGKKGTNEPSVAILEPSA